MVINDNIPLADTNQMVILELVKLINRGIDKMMINGD